MRGEFEGRVGHRDAVLERDEEDQDQHRARELHVPLVEDLVGQAGCMEKVFVLRGESGSPFTECKNGSWSWRVS